MAEKRVKDKSKIEELLIENFANLQTVLTNLSIKLDKLTDEISSLLKLFELSAKDLVKKSREKSLEDMEFLRKLEMLIEQNNSIERKLSSIEQEMEQGFKKETEEGNINLQPKPLPKL